MMMMNENNHNNRRVPIGVCFSGGGIRSAAFSLGGIAALCEATIVENDRNSGALFDVKAISTVSGGGYTGTALLAHKRAYDKMTGEDNSQDSLQMAINSLEEKLGVGANAGDTSTLPYTLRYTWFVPIVIALLSNMLLISSLTVPFGMTLAYTGGANLKKQQLDTVRLILTILCALAGVSWLVWFVMRLTVGTCLKWCLKLDDDETDKPHKAAREAQKPHIPCITALQRLHRLLFVLCNLAVMYVTVTFWLLHGSFGDLKVYFVACCLMLFIGLCVRHWILEERSSQRDVLLVMINSSVFCGVILCVCMAYAKVAQFFIENEGYDARRFWLYLFIGVFVVVVIFRWYSTSCFFLWYRYQLVKAFYPETEEDVTFDDLMDNHVELYVNTSAHGLESIREFTEGVMNFPKAYFFSNSRAHDDNFTGWRLARFASKQRREFKDENKVKVPFKLQDAMALSGAAVATTMGEDEFSWMRLLMSVSGVSMGGWYDFERRMLITSNPFIGFMKIHNWFDTMLWALTIGTLCILMLITVVTNNAAYMVGALTLSGCIVMLSLWTHLRPSGANSIEKVMFRVSRSFRTTFEILRSLHQILLDTPITMNGTSDNEQQASYHIIPHVFLSDGGHFENMAVTPFLYGLANEQVETVFVLDGEAGPAYDSFEALFAGTMDPRALRSLKGRNGEHRQCRRKREDEVDCDGQYAYGVSKALQWELRQHSKAARKGNRDFFKYETVYMKPHHYPQSFDAWHMQYAYKRGVDERGQLPTERRGVDVYRVRKRLSVEWIEQHKWDEFEDKEDMFPFHPTIRQNLDHRQFQRYYDLAKINMRAAIAHWRNQRTQQQQQ